MPNPATHRDRHTAEPWNWDELHPPIELVNSRWDSSNGFPLVTFFDLLQWPGKCIIIPKWWINLEFVLKLKQQTKDFWDSHGLIELQYMTSATSKPPSESDWSVLPGKVYTSYLRFICTPCASGPRNWVKKVPDLLPKLISSVHESWMFITILAIFNDLQPRVTHQVGGLHFLSAHPEMPQEWPGWVCTISLEFMFMCSCCTWIWVYIYIYVCVF